MLSVRACRGAECESVCRGAECESVCRGAECESVCRCSCFKNVFKKGFLFTDRAEDVSVQLIADVRAREQREHVQRILRLFIFVCLLVFWSIFKPKT